MKRPPCIPILLLYCTLFLSDNNQPDGAVRAATTLDGGQPATSATTNSEPSHMPTVDEHLEQWKQMAKEQLFDLRGEPAKPTPESKGRKTKFYVPRAMLERYLETRDTVREYIPDDRDFYGKINIADLDESGEDFWSAVYNKFGSYDIQVDLGPPKYDPNKADPTREATHAASVEMSREPEEVPSGFEPFLPPHSRSVQNQRKFHSVHLYFNLEDMEVYRSPTALQDLRAAELHVEREKLTECELYGCSQDLDTRFDETDSLGTKNSSSSTSSRGPTNNDNLMHKAPRYQRAYVLQVTGYDQYGEPKARIVASTRLDTHQTKTLMFNIYPTVRDWIRDPKSNFGLIVRVTNDDRDYEHAMRLKTAAKLERQDRFRNGSKVTNASETTVNSRDPQISYHDEDRVLEHVRLHRGFKFRSDDEDTWIRKRPRIIIYSKLAEPTRQHVKRHNDQEELDDTEGMQADDPGAGTENTPETTTLTGPLDSVGTDKPNESVIPTSTLNGILKREHVPSVGSARRMGTNSRSSTSSGRASSSSSSGASRPKAKAKPSTRQSDKCSKRTLAINFDEVGWSSWIIAPQNYYANFCSGDCSWPLSDVQNATNHAIIQAIYHSVGRVVPKSCCAPVKLGRMAILYQLDGIVQMRLYDEMIVEACGCL